MLRNNRVAKRVLLKNLVCLLVLGFNVSLPASPYSADDEDEANRIAETASRAQNAGDFELAIQQYEKLVADFPKFSQIGEVYYHAGFCLVQTGQFAQAADRLKLAIENLPKEQSVTVPLAYLYLGFAQGRLGRELAADGPEESGKWLTTATQTLATLLKNHPSFPDADQAHFFQGDAFEALGRLDEAAAAYEKVIENNAAKFRLDSIYALAFIRSKQGKYDQAHELFTQFEAAGGDSPLIHEARYFHAASLMELAIAAQNAADNEQTKRLYSQAAAKFESVYNGRDPKWTDKGRFQQAVCLEKLGRYADSARCFESVIGIEGTALADQARVYAGRDYLRAQNGDAAVRLLEKAIAVDSSYSAEAAHWLAQFYMQSKQAKRAYELAVDWIDKTNDENIKVRLMMDRADAAYANKQLQTQSRDLYLAVVEKHPQHTLAAAALYNAAYAAMESRDYDAAVELSERFRRDFANSDYLPDILEVEADSYLLAGKPEIAEKSFNELASRFAEHPKSDSWRIRAAVAMYQQKKYGPASETIQTVLPRLADAEQQAEAHFWMGLSYTNLSKPESAVEHLLKSVQASQSWRRADEALLSLSRAYFQNKQAAEAKQTTQTLIESFPQSALLADANYRLAEFEYDAGQFNQAIAYYNVVIEKFPDSQFVPYARYGAAWSQIQLKQFQAAADTFTALIDKHPKHALALQSLLGRGSALRQNKVTDQAVADLKAFLESEPVEAKRIEGLYELGLTQIDRKSWPDVINIFEQLLAAAPQSDLADQFHYELAWAYKYSDQPKQAIEHFQHIAQNLQESPRAAEANFHLAQDAYVRQDFPQAARGFQIAADMSQDPSIREKAMYKLAWSHFKLKDFEQALTGFRRQIESFPAGSPLYADAVFMVSESLFETNKFPEALQQYRVAKPIIETSETVSDNLKILTYLHGAQSANLAKEHQEAINFAQALLQEQNAKNVQPHVRQEAEMELGDAYRALNQPDKALQAYEQAARHPGRAGARSMCMAGEILFDQKTFGEAVNKFKLVLYGYGGLESATDVKPWQALAAYEAGRCVLVQIADASDAAAKNQLIAESKKHFDYVINNFPEDDLAPKARSERAKLDNIR